MRKTSIVLILVMLFLSLTSVTALEFDNTKSKLENGRAGYPNIEIKDWFGLVKLTDMELKENTNICSTKCNMETEIIMHQSGTLIDDIKFETLNGKTATIKDYKFYIQDGITKKLIDEYETQCNPKGKYVNGSDIIECLKVKTGFHYINIPNWIPYNIGDNVDAGTYNIRLEGEKNPKDTIDWIIKSQGIWIDEWAVWSPDMNVGLLAVYTFNETSGDIIDRVRGNYNLTVQKPLTRNIETQILPNGMNNSRGFNYTGPNDLLNEKNKTYMFWVNTTSAANFNFFVSGDNNDRFRYTSGTWILQIGGTLLMNDASDSLPPARWAMVTLTTDTIADVYNVYVNDTLILTKTDPATALASPTEIIFLGNGAQDESMSGQVTDIKIWNRTLTQTEINAQYNNYLGLEYSSESVNVNLDSPENNFYALTSPVYFNASFTTAGSLVNATLYIWKDRSLFATNFSEISGTSNFTNLSISSLTSGEYEWNYFGCNNIDQCFFDSNNRTLTFGFVENSNNFRERVAQTQYQSINISFNVSSGTPTASLNWNGESTSATITNLGGNEWLANRNFDTPLVYGNISFNWTITSGAFSFHRTNHYQAVNVSQLSFCNSTNAIRFVNFTFRDEATDTSMTAAVDASTWTYWLGDGSVTKTYLFSNTTANVNYPFCFTPADKTLNVDLSFKYSNTSYPQRTWTYDDQALTNSTTNKILYLLGSADGIYSSIQIYDIVGNPIIGASVTLERQFGATWTLLETATSDSSGLVTFWVNPNYDHRITASKTGYVTEQVTIRPSQSIYTLTLSGSGGNATFASDISGVRWIVYPGIGTLQPDTYNFNVTITSTDVALENCKFELLNVTDGSVMATGSSAATNSSYCYVGFNYAVTEDNNLFGRLSLDTDETDGYVIVNTDWKWIIIDFEGGDGYRPWNSISNFFSELKDLNEFGDTSNTRDFSRMVFFFLLATILIGIFTYFTGYELQSPGMGIFIIAIIAFFASAGGFLTIDSASNAISPAIEQWGFFFIFIILSFGHMLNVIRRTE